MNYMTCELYFNKTVVFKKTRGKEMDETGECRMTLEGGKESSFTGLLLLVGILSLIKV